LIHETGIVPVAGKEVVASLVLDANDLDRLRECTVGRCPQSGAALASQSTIGRLENSPRSEAARLCVALVDQFGETIKPGALRTRLNQSQHANMATKHSAERKLRASLS
jgi:hypothetical protein